MTHTGSRRRRAFAAALLVAVLLVTQSLTMPVLAAEPAAPVSMETVAGSVASAEEVLYKQIGGYAAASTMTTFTALDDDIPGVALPASPVSKGINASSDPHDVFSVTLAVGERLSVVLTGPDTVNADVYLLPPGTASVASGVPVAGSAQDTYPELFYFDCLAGQAGEYYIDVHGYSGSGTYTLQWSISASPSAADDDIPGVAIPASPILDSVERFSDTDDVYAIDLAEGDRLTVTLTSTDGDIDVYLFNRGATSVLTDLPKDGSATQRYPERFVFDVGSGKGGTYYIDVFARGGIGELDYTLSWKITSIDPPPEDIPGTALPASPFQRNLDWTAQYNDVYRIYMSAGQRFTVSLTGPGATTDFDVYLYDPGSGSVVTAQPTIWSDQNFYADEFVFDVPSSGTYYVEIRAFWGIGQYTCRWTLSSVTGSTTVTRIGGADRYDTAIMVSETNFPSGSVPAVCLATGEKFPDALSASGLAGAWGGPILLTRSSSLSPGVLNEIRRLGASKVFIIGGQSAVSSGVESTLRSAGLSIERVWGNDRYETSAAIAYKIREKLGSEFGQTAFVCRGDAYPDALAVSPFAFHERYPILLTPPNTLSPAAATAITSLGLGEIFVAGGKAAVGDGPFLQISSGSAGTVTRVWGNDRYETARAVADLGIYYYWGRPDYVGIATGANFPDALGGGAAMGNRWGVLLLTHPTTLSEPTRTFLVGNADDIIEVQLYGGTAAVSSGVETSIRSAVQ